MYGDALISKCTNYRYYLTRTWDETKEYAVFIGLNPSTADARKDDATIRRCVAYAKCWNFGGLCMINLFAFRATKPPDMKAALDPVGPANDYELKTACSRNNNCGMIIAAWGKDGKFMKRDEDILNMLPNVKCLKRNNDRTPSHPLYLKADLKPFPMRPVGRSL